MIDLNQFEAWFVTGSQHLYGDEVLQQVAANSQTIARALSESSQIPVKVVFKPVLTTPQAIRDVCLEANNAPNCIGLITWMHTFSPAKMWIAGLDALHKPFLHLHTQFNRDIPWSSIDMDFMNLNQSAHGCREFGFICSRMRLARKVVVGHWQDPEVRARIAAWARAASAWHDAQGAKIARLGDNMREVAVTEGDKVEAQIRLGYAVNGYGVGDVVGFVDAVTDAEIDRLVAQYDAEYQVARSIGPDGPQRPACAKRRKSNSACGRFWNRAVQGLYRHLRGPARPEATAGPGRAAADGRRLRLRRGRRLENGGPGPGHEGHGGRPARRHVLHGGLHVPPRSCGDEGAGGPHARDLPVALPRAGLRWKSTRWRSAAEDDPVRLVFDTPPGPAVNASVLDLGNRFRLLVNEVDVVPPDQPLPKLPVARALWVPRPNLPTAAAAWILAGGPHHTGFSQAVTPEHLEDFAEMAGLEFLLIDGRTRLSAFKKELRWNEMYYHLARGL